MDFQRKKKPKLVESKMLKKTAKKRQLIIEEKNKYKNMIINIFKENCGLILIITALVSLLYMRYKDVQKRKKLKNNNILKNPNNIV